MIVRTNATFSREIEVIAGYTQHVSGHFATHSQLVTNEHDFDTEQIVHELNLGVESTDVSAEFRRLAKTILAQLPSDRHATDADSGSGGQKPDDNYSRANPHLHCQQSEKK